MNLSSFKPWVVDPEISLSKFNSGQSGLSQKQVQKNIVIYGKNVLPKNHESSSLRIFLEQYKNPLILILLAATIVSYFLGDKINALIIFIMMAINSLMGFFQEYKAAKAAELLTKQITYKTIVIRERRVQQILDSELTLGDIVVLEPGSIVPADLRLFESNNFTVDQSILTGESVPSEKNVDVLKDPNSTLNQISNMVFMGTAVETGEAKGIVTAIGIDTQVGKSIKTLNDPEEPTSFDKGMHKLGFFLMRIIIVLTVFMFIVNALMRQNALEAMLFAVALAIGVTPELLPIILTINLARGAQQLARKNVIVKRLSAIENLGNAEILCTDKTGTLTEGRVALEKYVDINNKKLNPLLLYAGAASHKPSKVSKLKNDLDVAVWEYIDHSRLTTYISSSYEKIDELPFDFNRKRYSALVKIGKEKIIITKGAVEFILPVVHKVRVDGKLKNFSDYKKKILDQYDQFGQQGLRVLAITTRGIDKNNISENDEKDLILEGFLTFSDTPKKSLRATFDALAELSVDIKILTGDNEFVSRHVAESVGMKDIRIISGSDLNKLIDGKWNKAVLDHNIFVQITPEHKYRIIKTLQSEGKTIAFLGDGANDAPALKVADVGISVESAVDIAKSAADIILLDKSLEVIVDGIKSGRQTYGNIIKYILTASSSNIGNMISMAVASLFLPFLPMLPAQIILLNLLGDIPNLGIATDNVDPELMKKPKHWDVKYFAHFMIPFGLISSVFDITTFIVLLNVVKANQSLFHTGWFFESLLTQVTIIFAIRTRRVFFKSIPSAYLVWLGLFSALVGLVFIFSSYGKYLGFVPIPVSFIGIIVAIVFIYLTMVELAKRYYYKKFID